VDWSSHGAQPPTPTPPKVAWYRRPKVWAVIAVVAGIWLIGKFVIPDPDPDYQVVVVNDSGGPVNIAVTVDGKTECRLYLETNVFDAQRTCKFSAKAGDHHYFVKHVGTNSHWEWTGDDERIRLTVHAGWIERS
jgi:hypothetical protein